MLFAHFVTGFSLSLASYSGIVQLSIDVYERFHRYTKAHILFRFRWNESILMALVFYSFRHFYYNHKFFKDRKIGKLDNSGKTLSGFSCRIIGVIFNMGSMYGRSRGEHTLVLSSIIPSLIIKMFYRLTPSFWFYLRMRH